VFVGFMTGRGRKHTEKSRLECQCSFTRCSSLVLVPLRFNTVAERYNTRGKFPLLSTGEDDGVSIFGWGVNFWLAVESHKSVQLNHLPHKAIELHDKTILPSIDSFDVLVLPQIKPYQYNIYY